MSKDKIIASALVRFANQGYYHTSLAEIAQDVGIRKPSIYAHFPGKEKIFLALLEVAFLREKVALGLLTQPDTPPEAALREYFFQIPARFEESPYLRFWIRALSMPPYDLEKEIREYDCIYARTIDRALGRLLDKIAAGPGLLRPAGEVRDAFTGLLRGIHAELLYHGAEEARRKATAMWNVFALVFSRPEA